MLLEGKCVFQNNLPDYVDFYGLLITRAEPHRSVLQRLCDGKCIKVIIRLNAGSIFSHQRAGKQVS